MSVQQKRKYDSEFKRNAVLLSEESGRTIPEVAVSLGNKNDLLYRWRRLLQRNGEIAFTTAEGAIQQSGINRWLCLNWIG